MPSVRYRCHGWLDSVASSSPAPVATTPISQVKRGPRASTVRPISGLRIAETRKPNENTPAVTARSQPNSSRMGGYSSENAVRALTAIAIETNTTATTSQP